VNIPWNKGYYPLRHAILRLSNRQKNKLLQQTYCTEYGEPVLGDMWNGRFRYSMYLLLMSKKRSSQKTTRLDLRGCDVPYLPPEISGFTKLQTLLLCSNGLSTLPFSIGKLPLKNLSLGKNQITKIPPTLKKCALTLSFLTLGENQISGEYPFLDTDLICLRRGSIGNSQILEPIGHSWMTYKDACVAANRIQELLRSCALLYQKDWLDQAMELWRHLDEPMIDELMYQDCFVENGRLYTPFEDDTEVWLRYALRVRITQMNEGSVVHPSLWNKNLDPKWKTNIPTSIEWKHQERMSI
jgi:hypothetical protein